MNNITNYCEIVSVAFEESIENNLSYKRRARVGTQKELLSSNQRTFINYIFTEKISGY